MKISQRSIYFTSLLILIAIQSPSYRSLIVTASTATLVHVEPSSTSTNLDDLFTINASIADVTDLGGWELKLYFRNSILNWVSSSEGPFLKQGGSTTFFIIEFDNNYNATHGRVWLTCVLLGGGFGVSGSGTLATINFYAIGGGTTALHLADTILGNSTANPIPHTTADGLVEVKLPITILSVVPFADIGGQNYTLPINVTTVNDSGFEATFNLTTYCDMIKIETQAVTQEDGTLITTTFQWDTTGLSRYQNYSISAAIGTNTLFNGQVTIVCPGDIDVDKDVDIFDIVPLAGAYGSSMGQSQYVCKYDINCDKNIDIFDIVIAAGNYGYIEL